MAFRRTSDKVKNKRPKKPKPEAPPKAERPVQPKDVKRAKASKAEADDARSAFWRDPRFAELLGDHKFLLVDVGAIGGVPKEWFPLLHLLELVAFDPQWPEDVGGGRDSGPLPGEFPAARTLLPVALGGERGRRRFYKTRGPKLASFLRPDPDRWRLYGLGVQGEVEREIEVETTTLDAVVEDQGLRFVDFVKLDTQGSELEILEGSPRTFGELAFGLRAEVSFIPLYEDQPYFSDIDQYLRGKGFELFDFAREKRVHRGVAQGEDVSKRPGRPQLMQADPLYFRSLDSAAARLDALEGPERVRYLAGALVACLANEHVAYARELLEIAATRVDSFALGAMRDLVDACPARLR